MSLHVIYSTQHNFIYIDNALLPNMPSPYFIILYMAYHSSYVILLPPKGRCAHTQSHSGYPPLTVEHKCSVVACRWSKILHLAHGNGEI